MLKEASLKVLTEILERARSWPGGQDKIDEFASQDVLYNPKHYTRLTNGLNPERADRLYTTLRRALAVSPHWNYGPRRMRRVLRDALTRVGPHLGRLGTFCDIGCGKHNPLGAGLVMYLNGADRCLAVDMDEVDWPRAAEAMNDLVVDILRDPGEWLLIPQNEALFRERLRELHPPGPGDDPRRAPLATQPVEFANTRMEEAPWPPGCAHLCHSEAVLEYFNPFEESAKIMFGLMAPGALGHHVIDFRDHRNFRKPQEFGFWQYLTEDVDGLAPDAMRQHGLSNNCMRFSEFGKSLRQVGFEVLDYQPVERQRMPGVVASRLRGRYKAMDRQDLEIHTAWCVLRKPAIA